MATDVISQVVSIRADLTALHADLKNTENEFKSTFARIQGVGSSALAGLGIGLSIGGLAAAATQFIGLAKHAAEYADAIGKAAQITGTSTETLSAWRHGAELADVSAEELDTGITRLSRSITAAAQGSAESQAAFKSIGVSIKDASGNLKSTDVILGDLAGAFERMPDGALKTDAAMALLGRSGAKLIPLLNGGRQAVADFTEEARRMGLIVSSETAKSAEQFNDNMTRMSKSIEGLKIAIGNSLIPVLVEALDLFAKLGGIKLEGAEQRGLERQIKTLKEIRDMSSKPGSDAFNFYTDKIAEAEAKLKEFQKETAKPVTKTARVIVDTKSVDKAKNDVANLLQGLQKQLDSLAFKKDESLFGPDVALLNQLNTQLAEFKDKLRSEGLKPPKGLDEFFGNLRDKIVANTKANRELNASIEEGLKLRQALADEANEGVGVTTINRDQVARQFEAQKQLEEMRRQLQIGAIDTSTPAGKEQARIAGIVKDYEDTKRRIEELGLQMGATQEQTAADVALAWKKALNEINTETDELTKFQERAFERLQDTFSDLFRDLLGGQIKSIDDASKRLQKVFTDFVSEWAALQLKTAIFGPQYGKTGGQMGGLFGQIFGGGAAKLPQVGYGPRPAGVEGPTLPNGGFYSTPAGIAPPGAEAMDKALTDVSQSFGNDLKDIFGQFSRGTGNLLEDITRALTQFFSGGVPTMTPPFNPDVSGGASGFGGLIGGLFGGGGSSFGFGSAPAGVEGPLMANGGFFSNPFGWLGSWFHDGGPVGADTPEMAKRLMGGLKSDERLIVAQDGEFMMSRPAVRAIGMDRLQYANKHLNLPRYHDGGPIGMPDMPAAAMAAPEDARTGDAAGSHYHLHVHGARNPDEFRRSQAQWEAGMARAVRSGQRRL